MNIDSIINYNITGNIVLIPEVGLNPIEHVLTVKSIPDYVDLCNNTRGIINRVDFVPLSDTSIKIAIYNSLSSNIDIEYIETNNEVLKVSCKRLHKETTEFKDYSTVQPTPESNMISLRSRNIMSKTSTGNKNSNSNLIKIFSEFHSIFDQSFSKITKLMDRQDSTIFKRITVPFKPNMIKRDNTTLIESKSVYSSYKDIKLKSIQDKAYNYNYVITNNNYYKYENDINKMLPSTIYLKGVEACICILTGEVDDEIVKERCYVSASNFSRVSTKFTRIIDIDISEDSAVFVNTMLDCTTSHFVVNQYYYPSLSDTDGYIFKPYISLEGYNIVLSYSHISENVYKFTSKDIITSAYLTDDLDLVYTTADKVCYAKVAKNLQTTLNDPTVNNNPYVYLSDSEPNRGDWIDVIVNSKAWTAKTKSDEYVVKITNGDNTYFYNVDNNSLSPTPVYLYASTLKDSIKFSLFIDNLSSYIVTIYSNDLKQRVSAATNIDALVPYKTYNNDNKKLFLSNDKLLLGNRVVTNMYLHNEDITDKLIFVFEQDQDYLIEVNGYILSKTESTIPEDYVYRLTDYIIEVDAKGLSKLGRLSLTINNELESYVMVYINDGLHSIKTNTKNYIGA